MQDSKDVKDILNSNIPKECANCQKEEVIPVGDLCRECNEMVKRDQKEEAEFE